MFPAVLLGQSTARPKGLFLDAVFALISKPIPTTKPAVFSEAVLPLSVEFWPAAIPSPPFFDAVFPVTSDVGSATAKPG